MKDVPMRHDGGGQTRKKSVLTNAGMRRGIRRNSLLTPALVVPRIQKRTAERYVYLVRNDEHGLTP
jgi:hypothetical protein